LMKTFFMMNHPLRRWRGSPWKGYHACGPS
jgi:hypothetical protein